MKAALIEFPEWFKAVNNIPVDDLKEIPEDEMKSQFKLFVKRLEALTTGYSGTELQKLDTKILVKKLFDPEYELFVNIELVMHDMAVASVKHSCESILESFVSHY